MHPVRQALAAQGGSEAPVKPKAHWFVRKAKQPGGRCSLCGEPVLVGQSIVKYCKRWPHFECAKRHDAEICAGD
jgi:hypothetical protein